ncbi:MAG: ATP-binding protein [Bacteroidetes bacterium]|nr:ATP-binding protein [Bacteroidota bacterium]
MAGKLRDFREDLIRNHVLSSILWILIVASVYFIVGRLSLKLLFEPSGIAAVWPAAGVFLSAILLSRKSLRPYVILVLFITDFIIERLAGSGWNVSIVYAFSLTFDASLSTWLLIRFTGEPINFTKVRQVIGFIGLAVILSNAISTSLAALAPYLFLGESYWDSWKWWWSSDAVGNLLITPFILSWASVRFRVRGVTLLSVILTVNVLYLVLGPKLVVVGFDSPLTSVLAIQLYISATAALFLFLASVISEHKQSEEEIKQVTLNWNKTFDSIVDGIALLDANQQVIQSNKAFQDFTRSSQDDHKGKNCFRFVHGTNCPVEGCPYTRMQKSRQRESMELELNEIFCEIMVDPIIGDTGKIIGAVHIIADISERKKAEAEFRRAKEKAEESDRLKSTFLANMSHEIRTPMNAIVGFAQLLTDPGLTEEDRQRFSAIIQSRSDDLLHIINDILEISRIESGNKTIVLGEVNLNLILQEIEEIITLKLDRVGKPHLLFICEVPDETDGITFISDQYILKQVFNNLIDNAIKFTHTGSIRFGFNHPENGTITCFVSDTGIGINDENQAVIFEHFRQADIENSPVYGGSGLGLSICKGSLEMLGGRIWVESSPGKGSTFFFTIPFLPSVNPEMIQIHPMPAVKAKRPGSAFQWKGKKLLLVEDDYSNMDFLKIILKHTEAELVCVYDGDDLRKLYDRLDTFSTVLLDIRLPDANGWDLAREIKSLCPGLPVIVQTAYAMVSDEQKSTQAGCEGYVSKPIDKELLLNMISKFI